MPDNSSFAKWLESPYYALYYKNDNEKRLGFIKALLDYLRPSTQSKILYTGCGTGENCKAIAESGFDVTGIDYSFDAIRKAKEFENDNLHFFQHDMRLPFWINYFDFAFNLFTMFGYFNTLREHDNSVRTVSQALKLNSLFVMDYLNVHYDEDNLKENDSKIVENVEFVIANRHDDEYFFRDIQVKQQGETKEAFTEKLAKFSPGDFTDMFAYQGMQIQEIFGDYNFADYDIRKSPRLIFIAKKIRL